MIEITISSDPLSIGPTATRRDLMLYAGALGAALSEELGRGVRVALGSVSESQITSAPGLTGEHFEGLETRLRDIASGPEWESILSDALTAGA